MTIDELSDAVYEDLNGCVHSVSNFDGDYRLLFECNDWQGTDRRRRFELQFDGVPEATATPTLSCDVFVFDEDPILWEHNEPWASMYFYHRMADPFALLGRLHEANARLLEGTRELSRYWKADSKLLQGGYGCLADGPQCVIDEYSKIIRDELPHSIVPGHRPSGGYRVALFDRKYVVFRSVVITEV